MTYKIKLIIISCLVMATCTVNASTPGVPAIFGDNMVLQRDTKIPIWGWADPNETVRINFKGQTFDTKADATGKWRTYLGNYPAGGPFEMAIKGSTGSTTFKNILIGDVWLTSGQSNMEFGIQTDYDGKDAIAKATDTLIHFFYVPMAFSLLPQADIKKVPADSPNGRWVVCSPQMLSDPKWAWHGFSAVGYYFAQQIRKSAGVPLGMIASYKGGTPAQAWISEAGLEVNPAFTEYVKRHQALINNLEQAKSVYPEQMTLFREAIKKWNIEIGQPYEMATKQWEVEATQAKLNGLVVPLHPKPAFPAPREPQAPEGGFGAPANLYNAMVAPLVPYGIKGVIWYQGEGNGDKLADALEYKELFPRLISDWRDKWGVKDLPFLFVQLPNYRKAATTPSEGNWPWVREAQSKALALPNTGMAIVIEQGEAENIHPVHKIKVGYRLALVARKQVYGENIVASGPVYKAMKVENNKIRITFDHPENGLVIGQIQGRSDENELSGFGIAGTDQQFVWAKAVVEGNSILISADGVNAPVAVRYNWGDNPAGNLFNLYKLPASPFRTDSWQPVLPLIK